MTAWDAIRWIDDKQHNVYSVEDKLRWLSQVEAMACRLKERCGIPSKSREVEPQTELSVPEPYDGLYLRYLEAQIHYTGQEYAKYNNAMAMFSSLWQEYANAVRRGNAPRGQRNFF